MQKSIVLKWKLLQHFPFSPLTKAESDAKAESDDVRGETPTPT